MLSGCWAFRTPTQGFGAATCGTGKPAVMGQDQPAGKKRELTGCPDKRISIAVALGLMEQPMLDESHAVEGFDTFVVFGVGIDGNTMQQPVEIRDVGIGDEGTLE